MRKFDIGIVGWWYATNYGSIITYYALSLVLNKLGYTTVLIDRPEKESDPEGENVISRNFFKRYCNISESVKWNQISLLNDLCDTFMVGSDQVWTAKAIENMKYMFFLEFVDDDKKKIAYASSFGSLNYFNINKEQELQVQYYLNRFDRISIREDFGTKMIKERFGIDADKTIDPVFLIDKDDYNAISEESTINTEGEYVLAYILDPTPDKEKFINIVSGKLGMRVKIILDGRKGTFVENREKFIVYGDESICTDVKVADWVKLFRNSKYVLTDSHHGLTMAIIFEKQYICYANYSRGYERFTSLLSFLKMIDRMVDNSEQVNDELIFAPIDYEKVNVEINKEKKRSIKWLKGTIENPKEQLPSIILPDTVNRILKQEYCTGCGMCEQICPVQAIAMKENEEGFLIPTIDNEKCVSCGLCYYRCPSQNTSYLNEQPKCYAMMADDEIRDVSSSGGMFSVVAGYILNQGGYVCGAAFGENFLVEHVIVDNISQLDMLRGSKYIQSNAGNVYPQIKQLLEEDNFVLFTGMPCQVAGLYAYLGDDYPKLYTIDLLCHGITSYKVFDKYKKDIFGDRELKELYFKAKEPWGWYPGVNAYFSDGTKYANPCEKDSYYIAYLNSISKNKICGTCRFNKMPRQGDITIGDFWGVDKFDASLNDNKGTSMVLVNNSKGKLFFDSLKSDMQIVREVPLQIAINGNNCIEHPYSLNKNRNVFFEYLYKLPFEALATGCRDNRLYEKMHMYLYRDIPVEDREFYFIAKIASENSKGRGIVTWIRSGKFERILKKYFELSVAFGVSMRKEALKDNYILDYSILQGKAKEYYLVSLDRNYDEGTYRQLNSFGYYEIKDFIFRMKKPVVLEKYDLSKGNYYDAYGNSIEGFNAVIGKVVFRGFNNHIVLGKNISTAANIIFDFEANGYVEVGDGTCFNAVNKFELKGYNGCSTIIIGKRCRFANALWRLYGDIHNTSVVINDFCTFESDLEIHANLGKKAIIGKDCMFSYGIDLWSGDGHAIFDVNTAERINDTGKSLSYKDILVIGEHVWVGKNAFIMNGTNIGNGSIVGACSFVKGIFPNNCSIGGNPAKQINKDIAWSRNGYADNLEQCGGIEYAALTSSAKAPISSLDVLVVGGTRFMGICLVKELLAKGNNVTIATRGNQSDTFGLNVDRIIMDVTDSESVKKALSGRFFDIVYDNLAYCSENVYNVLTNVSCRKYIQLSSVEVYQNMLPDMKEEHFNPYVLPVEICNTSVGYIKGKRQAEAIAYQKFSNVQIVTVRIPYVTKTERLYYYCKRIVKQIPMNIEDVSHGFTFIRDTEVGRFLIWLAGQNFIGPINLASEGMITIQMILEYINNKTGQKAIIDTVNGDKSPFHEFNENTFSMNMDKAKRLGWQTSNINDWFWKLMDEYIERALRE